MSAMVKVKILKGGTELGMPGAVVEVTEEVAKHLCAERSAHDGHKPYKYRMAKPADEPEPEPDLARMTAGEAAAAGVKNVVDSSPKGAKAAAAASEDKSDGKSDDKSQGHKGQGSKK